MRHRWHSGEFNKRGSHWKIPPSLDDLTVKTSSSCLEFSNFLGSVIRRDPCINFLMINLLLCDAWWNINKAWKVRRQFLFCLFFHEIMRQFFSTRITAMSTICLESHSNRHKNSRWFANIMLKIYPFNFVVYDPRAISPNVGHPSTSSYSKNTMSRSIKRSVEWNGPRMDAPVKWRPP